MLKSLRRFGPIFLGPALISFTLTFLTPFTAGLYPSLCKFTAVTSVSFTGIQNYINAFSGRQDFVHTFFFIAAITIVSVTTINIFAFAITYVLACKLKSMNFFHTVFLTPNLIGGIVLGYTWWTIINAVLLRWQTIFVTGTKYGSIGITALLNWQMIDYMIIIYIMGPRAVPGDLTEATEADNAGKQLILRNVIVSMVMPSITICLFPTLLNSFKLFGQNLAPTNDQSFNTAEVATLDIASTSFVHTDFEGVGQIEAVISFLLISFIAFVQLRTTRGREAEA